MRRELLTIDGVINVVLGVLLLVFPKSLVELLGAPGAANLFWPNVLGGVLLGIGVALLLERYRPPLRSVGLGLGGAIAINLCGGLVVAGWLASGALALPTRGHVLLWALVVLLVGLSSVELYQQVHRAAINRPSNDRVNPTPGETN